jgi:hypothetical protein
LELEPSENQNWDWEPASSSLELLVLNFEKYNLKKKIGTETS